MTTHAGRPLRVVHAVQCGPTTGGTVSHVMTQAVQQKQLGVEVAVCAASEGLLADTCRAAGIPVVVEPLLGAQGAECVDGAAYADTVTAAIAEHRPDIVHAHLRHAGFAASAASARLGVPMVYTQHMGDVDPFLVADSLSASTMPIIAVSRWVQDKTASYVSDPGRIRYVPNGVETPRNFAFRLPKDGRPNVLFCGRLVAEKGADIAILALAVLKAEGAVQPLPRLHVAGVGSEELLLRRLAHLTGVDDDVTFHGSIPQAIHADAGADLVVVPSRLEPCGLVVMEAMSSEIPLIASDVGGIPEMIRAGVDGRLVEPDSPRALASAIGEALKAPSREAVESARLRYLQQYTARTMAERTVSVYLETLES